MRKIQSVLRMGLCTKAGPGRHQTPIVDQLWRRRVEAKIAAAQFQKSGKMPEQVEGQSWQASEKSPSESANSVTYAFSHPSAIELADKYRNPWDTVRVGRLLEDLDALAGTIAYDHCRVLGRPDPLIVTASVDRIVYKHRADLRDDITLDGCVSWVGKSSMEIQMRACSSWTDVAFLNAAFTFVARDPMTMKAARINSLAPATDDEKARFEMGMQRDAQRKEIRKYAKENPAGIALDAESYIAALDLLKQSRTLLSMPALADSDEVLLKETKLQNAMIAQPQHRNTAGNIFGGFLMRRAFELAFSTAYLFTGSRPLFIELDEVTFKSPVGVGDLLRLESCVLYTSEKMDIHGRATVHVEVLAEVIKPEKRESKLSNTFNFTFGVQNSNGQAAMGSEVVLRRVLPSTHEEAYRIMARYKGDLAQRAEDESSRHTD